MANLPNTRLKDRLAKLRHSISRRTGQNYNYKPLKSTRGEFRILMLPPLDSSNILSGKLKIVSMLDVPKPEYKTISYAWGDNTSSEHIFIDGKKLGIPASAHQALHGVLRRGYHGAIWIDSVCINQVDKKEREQQVSMMGGDMGIYSNTALNLIWLGSSESWTSQAIEAIELVLSDMRKDTGNGFERVDEVLWDPETRIELFSNHPFSVDFDRDLFLRFFDRPWFSRLWVVQEAVLAPASIMLCGDFEIQLINVLRAARWCWYKFEYLKDSLLDPQSFLDGPQELFDLMDAKYGLHGRKSRIHIYRCLRLGRLFATTLPVDKVYAALGLLAQSERESHFLRPDYSKSLVDVLRDASYAAGSESNRSGRILSEVSHYTEYEMEGKIFPSWVPRWDRPWQGDLEPRMLTSHSAASTGLHPNLKGHWTMDANVLSVEGFSVDCVKETSSVCRLRSSAVAFVEECHELWSRDQPTGPYVLQQDALFRTLVASTNSQGGSATPEDIRAFEDWYARTCTKNSVPPIGELRNQRRNDTVATLRYRGSRALQDCCLNRRFFTTSKGRIGVGPHLIQPGDSIVVVVSSYQPFILRRDRGLFHLVGECYVYGIMAGEAVQEHLASGSENTLFRIR